MYLVAKSVDLYKSCLDEPISNHILIDKIIKSYVVHPKKYSVAYKSLDLSKTPCTHTISKSYLAQSHLYPMDLVAKSVDFV